MTRKKESSKEDVVLEGIFREVLGPFYDEEAVARGIAKGKEAGQRGESFAYAYLTKKIAGVAVSIGQYLQQEAQEEVGRDFARLILGLEGISRGERMKEFVRKNRKNLEAIKKDKRLTEHPLQLKELLLGLYRNFLDYMEEDAEYFQQLIEEIVTIGKRPE
ncbi:MAG: hypothetical protein HY001_03260 [Candidatus Portnoybacteria bacterium]|nr:hypothetical protein [Candidatus Portnoybacteria bacterium]